MAQKQACVHAGPTLAHTWALCTVYGADVIDERIQLILGEEPRNLARHQQLVDVLQETLFLHLRVAAVPQQQLANVLGYCRGFSQIYLSSMDHMKLLMVVKTLHMQIFNCI